MSKPWKILRDRMKKKKGDLNDQLWSDVEHLELTLQMIADQISPSSEDRWVRNDILNIVDILDRRAPWVFEKEEDKSEKEEG